MGRRIFAEKNYNVSECVIPYEEFKVFSDREKGFSLNPKHKSCAITAAEELLDKDFPILTATEFIRYRRTGNRAIYQDLYNPRRWALMQLTLAEAYESQGRFIDKILDMVWMILEESTWVLPAHINPNPNDRTHSLPYSYDGARNYCDLYAGTTGAVLAWTWYICRDRFDEISPVINKRILENLHDRVINPIINHKEEQAWMGNGPYNWMNNWCPFILSQVLTVCALTTKDKSIRERVVEVALEGLDKFTDIYAEDGACDEGPGYWEGAGGALYSACLVLYDMTNGKINGFQDVLLKSMAEFFPKMYVSNGRFCNFSDAHSLMDINFLWGYDWGKMCNSELMMNFWEFKYEKTRELGRATAYDHLMYRWYRDLCAPDLDRRDFKAALKSYFPSLHLAISRESELPEEGLYLSLKGGHNSLSHNHNDTGDFTVFCDGQPIFIDAGVGTYTRRTFDKDRYTIWSMSGEWHNIPTINGIFQQSGRRYASRDACYDEQTGGLSIDLTEAYPAEANVEEYRREAVIEGGKANITDSITSKIDGEVIFNLLTVSEPKLLAKGKMEICGKVVDFDESLEFSFDSPDCTWEETAVLPEQWGIEKFYRIRLKAALKAGEKHTFKLVVNK